MNLLSNGMQPPPIVPPGTILPGTTIQLGQRTVMIDRYIAEGGFAHVYLATLQDGSRQSVVVKRIAAPDKERLAIVNSEIAIMKQLGRHKNIVEYMDSTMGKLEFGGYEILILMEFCGGGPVIDLMNRRLQNRLTESEILKIFSDVCEGVAYMHYSNPPILHRDIKVENILLQGNTYKLCDFGSATTNILKGDRIPRSVKDIQALEHEINHHTTLQYRAPEMLDLYMRKGIDEKIDVWALGVLLYKLCYYTTPFEEQGQLAILNVRYTIPEHPVFSQHLIGLIQSMLTEDPRQRPNIYKVLKNVMALRGLECPIRNIYQDESQNASYVNQNNNINNSPTANILSSGPAVRPTDALPSISPMRRGRPTRSAANPNGADSSEFSSTPTMSMQLTPNNNSSNNNTTNVNDSVMGFDDSFGNMSLGSTADPASKFSQPSAFLDDFDFGDSNAGPSSSSAGGASGDGWPEVSPNTKQFSLGFEQDDFGLSQESSSKPPATKPRPPSMQSATAGVPTIANNNFSTLNNNGSNIGNNTNGSKYGQQASGNGYRSGASGPSAPVKAPVTENRTIYQQSQQQQAPSLPMRPETPAEMLERQKLEQLGRFTLGGGKNVPDTSKTLDGMKRVDNTPQSRSTSASSGTYFGGGASAASSAAASAVTSPLNAGKDLPALPGRTIPNLSSPTSIASSGSTSNYQFRDQGRTEPVSAAVSVSSRPLLNNSSNSISSTGSRNTNGVNNHTSKSSPADFERDLLEQQRIEFQRQQQELLKLQREQFEEQQKMHRVQQEQLQEAQRKLLLQQQQALKLKKQQFAAQQQQQSPQQQQRSIGHRTSSSFSSSSGTVSASISSLPSGSSSSAAPAPAGGWTRNQQSSPALSAASSVPSYQTLSSASPSLANNVAATPPLSSATPTTTSYNTTSSTTSSSTAGYQPRTAYRSQQQQLNNQPITASTPLAPSLPTKSLDRPRPSTPNGGLEYSSNSTINPGLSNSTSASSISPGYNRPTPSSPAAAAAAGSSISTGNNSTTSTPRSRALSNAVPGGPKPEPMPKPSRFRMKDGGASVVAGEEEAFKRKFPSSLDFLDNVLGNNVDSEDQTSVRSNYSSPSISSAKLVSTSGGGGGDSEGDSPPLKSVRERVQRMNHGR